MKRLPLLAVSVSFVGQLIALDVMAQPERTATVRGIVQAEASATISSELVARVTAISHKVGESFRKGDILLSFDCARYEADQRAAEAEVETQQIVVKTTTLLLSRRATGSDELALANAKLAQASAVADSLRIRTAQCKISAPYDGRIVERVVDVFEMPQPNSPLLRIVKDGDLEVDVIVPSRWSVWLKPGHEFSFLVDETQTSHKVRLMNVGAVIDPISRTLKAWGRIIDNPEKVRPGMSGTATIALPDGWEQRDG